MTRFLRGRPSDTPDLRLPEDFQLVEDVEVLEAQGEAVHVRSLAGQLVFSRAKSRLSFDELLAESLGKRQMPLETMALGARSS